MTRGDRPPPREPSDPPERELPRAEAVREIDALVDECRDECLWFLRPGYYPADDEERLRVLDSIQRHADLARFKKAARLKAWLSLHSSSASAGS